MRSEYASPDYVNHILATLTTPNRLALQVSEKTGLRINDVLCLKTKDVQKGGRFTVQEQKTGKTKKVFLSESLRSALLDSAGEIYVFPNRYNGRKHRTRQAVFKDLNKARKLFRVKENISPHSMRKIYAVEQYEKNGGNLAKVKALLNHSDESVTYLYALANVLTKKASRKKA